MLFFSRQAPALGSEELMLASKASCWEGTARTDLSCISMLAFTGWAGLAFKAATAALKRAASSALCFFLCIHGAMQGTTM